ncbi:hypothetical protein Syun_026882 [Stephania yunnanensis]|uniref:Uncharacterized protein n=1 Tax=Stephania yunnanensis TaxID=152371 RepID=A0AAP0EEL4_9MAGN
MDTQNIDLQWLLITTLALLFKPAPIMLLMHLCFLMTQVEATIKVPAIIVFGDSTVDAGNNNHVPTLARSNFEPYGRDFEGGKPTGRFCNGRLATDFFSEALGIKPFIPAYLDPGYSIEDFATGVTFASAGTGYDNLTSQITNVIPLWKQIEYFKDYKTKLSSYLGKTKAEETIQEALFVTSLGTNDFVVDYYVSPSRPSQFTIEEYQNFLAGIAEEFIREMYTLGARRVAVAGLPPIGCLPVIRSVNFNAEMGGCREDLNNLARDFGGKVSGVVSKLSRELKGTKMVFLDLVDKPLQIIRNPHLYGLENVGRACCGTGTFEFAYACHEPDPFTCTNASTYAFWDSVHPTEVLYHIVADHLVKTALAQIL